MGKTKFFTHGIKAYGADLTEGSILRHLVKFSIPMLFGNALQVGYIMINALWVGRGLGPQALAALTVSFSVYFVLIAVAAGLTLATSILVSQAYGAKDMEQLKRVVNNSVVLIGGISIVCLIAGFFLSDELLALMNTPAELISTAENYLHILMLATPFLFGMFLAASLLRGTGDAVTPLYFQGGAIVMIAILDPLLMFGWLGFPRLGVYGTAVATTAAHIIMLGALLFYLKITNHIASPDWWHLRMDTATSLLTLKIGIPSMLQQALVAAGMVAVVGLVNKFGSNGTAAYGITLRMDQFAMMPGSTIGMGVSVIAGQNIGAQRFDRVKSLFWTGLILSLSLTLAASAAALVMPKVLMGFFVTDPEVIAIGAMYLRILAVGYLLFAVTYVSNGIINGSGHTLVTTIIILISLWLIRIPLATYLVAVTGKIEAIWLSIVISFAVLTLTSVIFYAKGGWQRSLIKPTTSEISEG